MRVLGTQGIYWRQYIKVDYHRQQDAAYRYRLYWDIPTAEEKDLKSLQCEFESHSQYMLIAQSEEATVSKAVKVVVRIHLGIR